MLHNECKNELHFSISVSVLLAAVAVVASVVVVVEHSKNNSREKNEKRPANAWQHNASQTSTNVAQPSRRGIIIISSHAELCMPIRVASTAELHPFMQIVN